MDDKVTQVDIDAFMNDFLGVQNIKESKSIKETDEMPTKYEDCERHLVSVKYRDKEDKTLFGGREYSYYTKLPLQPGDLVVCPTRFGASVGKVCRTDVKESEVEKFKDALKEIDTYFGGTNE